mgnify:CR=1 FL=1
MHLITKQVLYWFDTPGNPTLDAPRDINKASVDVCECNSHANQQIIGGAKHHDGMPAGYSALSSTMPSVIGTMPSIGF